MATLYTINVTNNSPNSQDFFFFQAPAVYVGGPTTYSNSIYNQTLQSYSKSGAVLTFELLQQYYAGAQTRQNPPIVGQASGFTTASQPIDLTSSTGGGSNTTQMSVDPLGLGPAANTAGVQLGAFRIVAPEFNPAVEQYNAGLAVLSNSQVVLSNFVTVQPNQNIDCQPVLIFYVQTGSYESGEVINFSTSSIGAAECDTTAGYTTFNVSYNADGTWTVQPDTSAALRFAGLTQLIGRANSPAVAAIGLSVNTSIKNEAGTSVLCTGSTSNYTPPFQVTNLDHPAALKVRSEYQVGPTNGPFRGRMCTAITGNTATFGS